METQKPRTRVPGFEGITHHPGPDPAGGPVLGDLFKKVIVGIKEKREARGKFVNIHPPGDTPAHIFHPISQGEG